MFRYVIFHIGATLSSLHLRHSSFSNPSVVSPTSHLILQLFRSFTYVTSTSPTSSCEPPMIYNGLYHGCTNHDTEGKRFKSPIHCCDVMKPLYLFSGELWTPPLHCKLVFVYTVFCRRTGQCFSVLRKRHTDVVDSSSGRSYVTEK